MIGNKYFRIILLIILHITTHNVEDKIVYLLTDFYLCRDTYQFIKTIDLLCYNFND